MKWYAASLIISIKFKKGRQRTFPFYENIVLIKAKTDEEALEKANRRGLLYEGDDSGSFCWGNKPANMVFIGVRKVIDCEQNYKRPDDGIEVTYSLMKANTLKDLNKVIKGSSVQVIYEE